MPLVRRSTYSHALRNQTEQGLPRRATSVPTRLFLSRRLARGQWTHRRFRTAGGELLIGFFSSPSCLFSRASWPSYHAPPHCLRRLAFRSKQNSIVIQSSLDGPGSNPPKQLAAHSGPSQPNTHAGLWLDADQASSFLSDSEPTKRSFTQITDDGQLRFVDPLSGLAVPEIQKEAEQVEVLAYSNRISEQGILVKPVIPSRTRRALASRRSVGPRA